MCPELGRDLRVSYINSQGLAAVKRNMLCSMLQNDVFDFIIVAETWFVDQPLLVQNPYFVASTPLTNKRTVGHQNGGMCLLAKPAIKSLITQLEVTEFSIKFKIGKATLLGVYLPPSLSALRVQAILEPFRGIDAAFGDFNIRLGTRNGDRITTPNRNPVISTFSSRAGLTWTRNSNVSVCSRNDHVFSKIPLTWTYDWGTGIQSDHGMLNISIPSSLFLDEDATPRQRYSMSAFRDKVFRKLFCHEWDIGCGIFLNSLTLSTLRELQNDTLDTESSMQLIDLTYGSFLEELYALMDFFLPKYDAEVIKTSASKPSTSCPIRDFKRSQRAKNALSPLVSSTETESVVDQGTNHYAALFSCDDEILPLERGRDISALEWIDEDLVMKFILSYSTARSIGPDLIHTRIFRVLTASRSFLAVLTNLFRTFAFTGLTPTVWQDAFLHILPKDSSFLVTQTRPIVLSQILRRIFEKLCLDHWSSENENGWLDMHFSQAGFRKGYSTMTHILIADELCRTSGTTPIFLDLKNAFDSVRWRDLRSILIERGCPTSVLNLICSLCFRPANLHLSINRSNSRVIQTFIGLFQGGVISPSLFGIFIDTLATRINAGALVRRPIGLFFADDVCLFPNSAAEAHKLLEICHLWSTEFHMKWNHLKCGSIGNYSPLLLGYKPIPIVERYKYLGVLFGAKGALWRLHFEFARRKTLNFLSALDGAAWSPRNRLLIFKAFVRPIFEYCLSLVYIWAKLEKHRLAVFLANFKETIGSCMQFVFQSKSRSQLSVLLAGLGSVEFRLELLHASFSRHFDTCVLSNPLVSMSRSTLSTRAGVFLLPYLKKSHIYSEFRAYNSKKRRKEDKLSYSTWILHERANSMDHKTLSLKLLWYASERLVNSDLSDCVFRFPADLAAVAIKWRIGTLFLNRKCSCGEQCNRRHINSCLLQDFQPAQAIKMEQFYKNQYSIISRQFGNNHHFSVLDAVLNVNHAKTFQILLDHIYSKLARERV